MYKIQLLDAHGKVVRDLPEIHLSATDALKWLADMHPKMTVARAAHEYRIVMDAA